MDRITPWRLSVGTVRAMAAAGAIALCLAFVPARAGPAPRVVVSLKPLHSLVAGVMDGIGSPSLLVTGGASPHGTTLRPSEARALSEAALVFWVGPQLEAFLARPLRTLVTGGRVITLTEAPGMRLLPAREGGVWEAHDSARGGTEGGARKAREGELDLHLWLDPENAKRIVEIAAAELSRADAANAARYRSNGTALAQRIDALDRELRDRLAPVARRPYVVFHDAYQYFERRYGLNAAGSITVSPERAPGARRLREIREKVATLGATCVFSEPQFEPALVAAVTEGNMSGTGVLDPLGTDLPAGPEAYFALMRGLATALENCLKAKE